MDEDKTKRLYKRYEGPSSLEEDILQSSDDNYTTSNSSNTRLGKIIKKISSAVTPSQVKPVYRIPFVPRAIYGAT